MYIHPHGWNPHLVEVALFREIVGGQSRQRRAEFSEGLVDGGGIARVGARPDARSAVKRGSVYWTTAYPPTIRYLTLPASKSRNSSQESELRNIETLCRGRVNDQLPGGVEARLRRLCLPEPQIERAIRIFQLRATFDDVRLHEGNGSKSPCSQVARWAVRDRQRRQVRGYEVGGRVTRTASRARAPEGRTRKGLRSRLSMVSALAAAKSERRDRAAARASRSAGGWPRRPVRTG